MWKRYKNWRRLMKYIRKSRGSGISEFRILTTDTEIIVNIPDGTVFEQLRLKSYEYLNERIN